MAGNIQPMIEISVESWMVQKIYNKVKYTQGQMENNILIIPWKTWIEQAKFSKTCSNLALSSNNVLILLL